MCGRYTLKTKDKKIAKLFQADLFESFEPHYNIPPTYNVPIVRVDRETRKKFIKNVRWALPLFDVKTKKFIFRLNNARSESISEKQTFSKHFREDRCLIPADGFYEWKDLGGKVKQPYFICMKDESPFAFAGIWDRRTMQVETKEGIKPGKAPKTETIESCSIITVGPNSLMSNIHDRMPVILDKKNWEAWLDPKLQDEGILKGFLKPYPAELMQAWPVKKLVGDTADCIKRVTIEKN